MSFSFRPLPNFDAILANVVSSVLILTILSSTSTVQVMLLLSECLIAACKALAYDAAAGGGGTNGIVYGSVGALNTHKCGTAP